MSVARILDNGWNVAVWRNELKNYTAAAMNKDGRRFITDRRTPEDALNAIADKVLGTGEYQGFDYEKDAAREAAIDRIIENTEDGDEWKNEYEDGSEF